MLSFINGHKTRFSRNLNPALVLTQFCVHRTRCIGLSHRAVRFCCCCCCTYRLARLLMLHWSDSRNFVIARFPPSRLVCISIHLATWTQVRKTHVFNNSFGQNTVLRWFVYLLRKYNEEVKTRRKHVRLIKDPYYQSIAVSHLSKCVQLNGFVHVLVLSFMTKLLLTDEIYTILHFPKFFWNF